MFELVLKSSKDVKKLVIEFGEDSVTSSVISEAEQLPEIAETVSEPKRSNSAADLLAERAMNNSSKPANKPKTTETRLPEIAADRAPNVDNSFTESF